MTPCTSHDVRVRSLAYHVRTWGSPADRPLVLLHGWMDVSAGFQFLVDALAGRWFVIAPDWRGFGRTEWAGGGYWFPDYLADLEVLLDHFCPNTRPVVLGHSMGGNIAGLYAGVRPGRFDRLLLAEGFGLRPTHPDRAPARYAEWLDQIRNPEGFRSYAGIEAVVARLRTLHPRLTEERARHLAPHWSTVLPDGMLGPAADPAHRRVNPVLYRQEEALAVWCRIDVPTLWIWGGDPDWMRRFAGDDQDDWARRRAAFRQLAECTIPDSGHMMHYDQPDALARVVEDFTGG